MTGLDGPAVGRPHTRLEGREKVTGRARYSSDVRLPGQLVACVLRSPHPHARIVHLDVSPALALPGVHAVLSSANAPDIPWYDDDESRLFDRTLRFAGDEVAAVAAENEEAARDALRAIDVRYEPLPFAVGLDDGRESGPKRAARGDVDAGFREADVVIERTYETQPALHNAMEAHGCTAHWDADTLVLHESTQGIHAVAKEVAEKLGLPRARVRVITEHMGGGFGAKQIAWKHSVIAALLSQRTGRPVRLVLDRDGENLAAGNRNATRQHVRLGAKRDGTLTAIDARIRIMTGAYKTGGEESDVIGTYQTLYRCPNVRAEQVGVRTNTGPAVAFRAPGYVEGTFALESAMDELAAALRIDPVELRLRNVSTHDPDGKPYTSADSLRRCIERVGARYREWRAAVPSTQGTRRRGVGFAAHDWAAGQGHPPARARAEIVDGRVRVVTGTQDIGTGTRTALAQIAADAAGVGVDRVELLLGDTARGLPSPTSAGSATLASLGPAVLQAVQRAKADGHGEGARGANPDDRAIRTCGAQCVEVEVDTATGHVRVLRVAAAHDCGRIVNPLTVDSQLIGGITQGVGFALTEQRIVDAGLGVSLNANLEEYKVPTAADRFEIVSAMESLPDDEANATGAKGFGEPPIIATAPAIANAIADALGVRLRELPLGPERLLR